MMSNVIEVFENMRLDFTVSSTGPAPVPAGGWVVDTPVVVFVAPTLVTVVAWMTDVVPGV
jgi:hypothetical protein